MTDRHIAVIPSVSEESFFALRFVQLKLPLRKRGTAML
jgi:hypothetical protein